MTKKASKAEYEELQEPCETYILLSACRTSFLLKEYKQCTLPAEMINLSDSASGIVVES